MGGAASKRKGSAFEREVCAILSLWLSGGSRKDLLWRSAMSGGRHLPSCMGDVSAVTLEGTKIVDRFVIECKSRKADIFLPLVWGRVSPVIQWWNKLVNEAASVHKAPLLIVRQLGRPILAGIDGECAWGLCKAKSDGVWFSRLDLWVMRLEALLMNANFKTYVMREKF